MNSRIFMSRSIRKWKSCAHGCRSKTLFILRGWARNSRSSSSTKELKIRCSPDFRDIDGGSRRCGFGVGLLEGFFGFGLGATGIVPGLFGFAVFVDGARTVIGDVVYAAEINVRPHFGPSGVRVRAAFKGVAEGLRRGRVIPLV